MKRHRIAVVGCGGMESGHERALDSLRRRVEVAAAVDVVPERAEAAASVLGAPVATGDYREVLDSVDSVLLVLPHHLHHPIGLECLRAGKHVLMEKPLAISESESLDLVHAADEARKVLMVGYVMRYSPLVVKLKELIDEGEIGDLIQISIWTEQLVARRSPDHWFNTVATLGGGQFFSHGCHYIDLLFYFLGSPVRGSHLGTRIGSEWMEGEGTSNVSIEFESGALGYHFGTWSARGSRLRWSIHAHGTKGMAEIEYRAGELRIYSGDTVRTVLSVGTTKPLGNQLEHFLDAIDNGTRPATDGVASLRSLRAIWRLHEAERANVMADLRGLGDGDVWDEAGLDQLPAVTAPGN